MWDTITGDDEGKAQIELEGAQAKEFRDQTYGQSNPTATAVGEFATTAPTMLAPGGALAQMAMGGVEMGLDHESEFRRDDDGNIIRNEDGVTMTDSNGQLMNAAVGAGTTGVFGLAFDFLGRAFKNAGGEIAGLLGVVSPECRGRALRKLAG